MRFNRVDGVWQDWGKPCKTFPLQTSFYTPENLPWTIAEEAYKEYAKRYGTQQSLKRLAERGGFGCGEIC